MTLPFRTDQAGRRVDLASWAVEAQRAAAPADDRDYFADALRAVRELLARDYPDILRDRGQHRTRFLQVVRDALHAQPLTAEEQERAYDLLSRDFFGFGRLDPFMQDPAVTEIIVDGPHAVDVEIAGRLQRVAVTWRNDAELQEYIKNLIRESGRPLDLTNPIVDCEVAGARVNATAPPVSQWHTLNIRKSTAQTRTYTPAEYIQSGAITLTGMRLLLALARGAATILICGATGTGKTTLARILIEAGARPDLRWLVIEDVRETEARVERFVSLQTVQRDPDPITVNDLFAATKRKRPDRIAVGEIRSPDAAVPFVMTTMAGHEGPISTMHAGTEHDAIFTFVFLLKMAGLPMSEAFLERMLHRQLNILVFVRRFRDGRRRVVRIVEVRPLESGESGFVPLMVWNPQTDQLEWTRALSADLALRLALNDVVVPTPDDEVTADTYQQLDSGDASAARSDVFSPVAPGPDSVPAAYRRSRLTGRRVR